MRRQSEVTSEIDGYNPGTNSKSGVQTWCKLTCVAVTFIVFSLILLALYFFMNYHTDMQSSKMPYSSNNSVPVTKTHGCRVNLLESIPTGAVCDNNSSPHRNAHDSWLELIATAQSSIDILSYEFALSTAVDYCRNVPYEEDEDLLMALLKAGRDRGVRIRMGINDPDLSEDSKYLATYANAQVKHLNFTRLFGKGVMHVKLMLVDRIHYYFGSADMSRYSLEVYKELGLLATNCTHLGNDVAKIFDGFYELPEDGIFSATRSESLATVINIDNPMHLIADGNEYRTFLAISPEALSTEGRTYDLDAILHCINKAEKFIYINMVKYFPLIIYKPNIKYWPIIDDALRRAAIERKVHIRFLINRWKRSNPSEIYFLKSLTDLTGSYENVKVEAKFFSAQVLNRSYLGPRGIVERIFNQNKYMVTDSAAYIGTSNLSGENFDFAGLSQVFEDIGHNNTNSIRQQLEDVFQRDWTSRYAYYLNATLPDMKESQNSSI